VRRDCQTRLAGDGVAGEGRVRELEGSSVSAMVEVEAAVSRGATPPSTFDGTVELGVEAAPRDHSMLPNDHAGQGLKVRSVNATISTRPVKVASDRVAGLLRRSN